MKDDIPRSPSVKVTVVTHSVPELNSREVIKFVKAVGKLMQFKPSPRNDERRMTIMFSYGPQGWVNGPLLASATEEQDMDMIHLEFEPRRETEGPVNILLCEDRNGTILTWPKCGLWADRDPRSFLLVPEGQDFGFASDGAALVCVTDLDTGPQRALGIARARALLKQAVS